MKAKAMAKTKKPTAVAEAATNRQQELSSLMQQIYMCNHGHVPWQVGICAKFASELLHEYNATINRGDSPSPSPRTHTIKSLQAMKSKEEYAEVWNGAGKMKLIVSYFLSLGTEHATEGNMWAARVYAHYACFFEEYIASELNNTQASMNRAKMVELLYASDDHTLISYLKHRIPCTCLNDLYKQVKSTKKMGLCFNEDCCYPDRMVERDAMLNCTRCRSANYCSRECQVADWPRHKKMLCDEVAKAIASFNFKQNSKLSQI